jgi:CRP/FNR family transcriptional regulator, anaerobic regulatory protein
MDWISQFPGLSRLEEPIRRQLVEKSVIISVPKGTVIFGPGKAPENLLLLLGGTVRVQQTSENGREIVLYRVSAGESCVLTTACLLAYEDYSAEGLAETDVQAVAIPRSVFDQLIAQSDVFRRFVFSAYSRRITDLFFIIEEVAFQRMDIRLAHKILDLPVDNEKLHMTHQQLAAELGTAREVISRLLQEFQRRQWIEIGRGEIKIKDRDALSALAAST